MCKGCAELLLAFDLILLVGQQEGNPSVKKLSIGLLVMMP